MDYTPGDLPTLQRIYTTKFWMNMLRKTAEGEYTCKDTIDYIQKALKNYKDQMAFKRPKANLGPYQMIEESLKVQGKINLSNEEIVEAYLTQMKEDLIKNLDYQESDSSMKTVYDEDENQFQCLAGESQPLEDISIEEIFNTMKANITKSIKDRGECSTSEKDKALDKSNNGKLSANRFLILIKKTSKLRDTEQFVSLFVLII